MSLDPSVLQEIELLVTCGFENRASIFVRIVETLGGELGLTDETTLDDLDPAMVSALRSAIEDAFARKAEASRSWPVTTDCDRLRTAFDLLAGQGIVALENCGFTQDEGIDRAALVALARDELGGVTSDGYCFFHEQDAMHAAAEGGLWLAFGAFLEAAPMHAKQVGDSVVPACREVGLAVEWDGSPGTRIALPALQWRRRMPDAAEPDIAEFLASWELEIRAGYTPASEISDVLAERAGDWFAEFASFGPVLLDRLQAHTEQFLDAERAGEARWGEATINDRITAAFEELRERGVLALECSGLRTMTRVSRWPTRSCRPSRHTGCHSVASTCGGRTACGQPGTTSEPADRHRSATSACRTCSSAPASSRR